MSPNELTKAIDQNIHSSNNTLGSMIHSEFKETLDEMLETLTDREENVLRLRYLDELPSYLIDQPVSKYVISRGYQRSQQQIAHVFGVTPEKIRQIENKALKKLRHPSRADNLYPYFIKDYDEFELNDEHNQLPVSW